ncbi:hypothetical protein V8F20_010703 [Naviculisporaceae sp. PSN 640]
MHQSRTSTGDRRRQDKSNRKKGKDRKDEQSSDGNGCRCVKLYFKCTSRGHPGYPRSSWVSWGVDRSRCRADCPREDQDIPYAEDGRRDDQECYRCEATRLEEEDRQRQAAQAAQAAQAQLASQQAQASNASAATVYPDSSASSNPTWPTYRPSNRQRTGQSGGHRSGNRSGHHSGPTTSASSQSGQSRHAPVQASGQDVDDYFDWLLYSSGDSQQQPYVRSPPGSYSDSTDRI